MTTAGVLTIYQQRIHALAAETMAEQNRQWFAGAMLLAGAMLFLALAIATVRRQAPLWTVAAPLPLAAWCARRYGRCGDRIRALARLHLFYEKGQRRLTHQWRGTGDTGEEYEQPGHLYARDLQLFGEASLFERLSIARTETGQRKLAAFLQDRCSLEETRARQEAVQELTPLTALREQIATLGHEYQQSHTATFADWLARPVNPFPAYLQGLTFAVGLLAGVVLCLAIARVLPLSTLAITLTLPAVMAWALRPRVAPSIEHSLLLSVELDLAHRAIQLLSVQKFRSPKLAAIVERIQPAPHSLRTLARYLRLLNERTKEHFYLPSSILLLGSQTAMAIENWRARHGTAMAGWVEAWSEFEALQSLACYAYENPEDAYPTFAVDTVSYSAQALGHPLVAAGECVRNDVHLPGLLMISGSNMAGKSTLLRAIGMNAVLAAAGAPVRAASLHLSPFTLVASLSIQDALAEGRSRFLAEVERLRAAIQLSATHPPLLFLIDEIFSGTNSADRRQAAEAVLRTLGANHAMGAVSTHDLALTTIDLPLTNVHMCARSHDAPLDFDYLLKPGVNTQSNALAIARLAGVPV